MTKYQLSMNKLKKNNTRIYKFYPAYLLFLAEEGHRTMDRLSHRLDIRCR